MTSKKFSPIAIVGRACVLPGALSPAELWQAVAEGRDLIGPVPKGRWQLDANLALCAADQPQADRTWSDRGGYVQGFEQVWNPNGFAVEPQALEGLDPLVAWTLHCAREARNECRFNEQTRIGAVFGNLGFPSQKMAAFAHSVWAGGDELDPRNRFMSSATAEILQQAMMFNAGSHCLDAACASSLYAIKLACDRLQEHSADLMLAGAVQGADDLFLHIGFCALNALSRSGQSRPFHADADGLIPAEGAAFVALKRLDDARRDGDTIYGVIRGIGLSNDGRGKGLLAPAEEGQQRAMRAAYQAANLSPSQVSLLECHATGTPVGDATELASSAAIFSDCDALPIGSLKSNLGHLITTAGAAGLIKVLEAMRVEKRPPTLHVDKPTQALANKPFRLLQQLENWPSKGARIAAISAFGFGGNNAHLIVSEDDPELKDLSNASTPVTLAIVGLGAMVSTAGTRDAFREAIFSKTHLLDENGEGRMSEIKLDLEGIRFPPRDLAQTLPQQLAILQTSREALADTRTLPRERTGVFIGIEPDPEVARYGTRWRLAQSAIDSSKLNAARDLVVPALESAAVLGTMPNIPANRLSSQFDFGGPAFTVQSGSDSGLTALRIAAAALARGELDAALVGAVDFGCEPVNRTASTHTPGDAAISLVLKRLEDAERDGDQIFACIDSAVGDTINSPNNKTLPPDLSARFGHAGAAQGLVQLASAALCQQQHCNIDGEPAIENQAYIFPDQAMPLRVTCATALSRCVRSTAARLRCFTGIDKSAVIKSLIEGKESSEGDTRLVLVCEDSRFEDTRSRALSYLQHGTPAGTGVHFSERPIVGEIAFVFAGAGASYHGMGRELLQHFPQLREHLMQRSRRLPAALAWAVGNTNQQPTALEQLWGASALSQLHLEFSQDFLGLKADAFMGYSSGETNALVASGAWQDPDALMDEMENSGLVTELLGGQFTAVAKAWNRPVQWASWTVLAPLSDVEAALIDIPQVHIAIINGENDCLIAGDEAGCAKLVARIGDSRCLRLVYPLAVHVPEVAEVAQAWLELHRRKTFAPGARVYSNAFGAAYVPDREKCARAILEQADRTLDLRPAVLAAWNDGVRVFIEHGPAGAYGRAIRNILGEREALVVSLDRKGQGIEATMNAVAALLAAGVPVRHDIFEASAHNHPLKSLGRHQAFSAHSPPVVLPNKSSEIPTMQTMQSAPRLPSVLENNGNTLVTSIVVNKPISEFSVPQATTHFESPLPAPIPKPVAAASQMNGANISLLAQYQSQIAALARVQTEFAERQAQVHQKFMALGQASMNQLLQAASHSSGAAIEVAPAVFSMPASPVVLPSLTTTLPAIQLLRRSYIEADNTGPLLAIVPTEVKSSSNICTQRTPTGPSFSREQLLVHSNGDISELFGEKFKTQSQYFRQVRMPKPPLLLADRVVGLAAEPDSMGKGIIWTETDVKWDSWYLNHGHMPAGILIEAGQADLMLISYLGVDKFNRSDRVYRLLGCELTYHGDLPRAGDTLRFEIELDSHAAQGDVRLMFFHYDCLNGERPQLSVSKGQAGFFTDAELAESAGCLWSPEQQTIVENPRLDPPTVANVPQQLQKQQLQALASGDAFTCFGPGFELAQTHTRTPGLQADTMLLLDRVSELDPVAGAWGRGYLRAELDINPSQWFFDGHFKNDPCMPGTLMFEGCLQAMSIYLAAMGYTLVRDGWRFQPVPEIPYQLQCRGQVTPSSRLLVTEVFVEEIIAGPIPTIYADLLCTVDGLKAFHARRVGLQLVPDWPLRAMPDLLDNAEKDLLPVAVVDGFRFDQKSLLACANGRPSDAFGPMYKRFDGTQRVARLPSPPYLFMSRISEIHGPIGVMKAGAKVVAEYDVPDDAWYFDDNGCRTMPFAVLLEAALQPCGWLSSYVGSALTEQGELGFRNLDGEGILLAELHDDCGTLTTEVELTAVSATAGMIIENFSVRCRLGKRVVYKLDTVFGFFPPAALANQAGLKNDPVHQELLLRASDASIDLTAKPDAYFANDRARLADGMMLMLDRIEGHWPNSGAAGLGQLRAVKDIDCSAWFFKAHFFQDPVQPGSLGLEAMLQALQFHMLQTGMDEGIKNPRFEPIALGRSHSWKYRGQVLPKHSRVHTTLEITEIGRDEHGVYALANASLWADAQRIYEMSGVGMRIVAGI